MMSDREHELPSELEARWRRWAETEPSIDERQLRRDLLQRIRDRRTRPHHRLVWVAAAASLVALVIGVETNRRPQSTMTAESPVVHETGANVILVLREGSEPIYLATEVSSTSNGEEQ